MKLSALPERKRVRLWSMSSMSAVLLISMSRWGEVVHEEGTACLRLLEVLSAPREGQAVSQFLKPPSGRILEAFMSFV